MGLAVMRRYREAVLFCMGVTFCLLCLGFSRDAGWLRYLLLAVLLAFPAYEDWRTGYISDMWSILIGVSGLAQAFFFGGGWGFVWSLLGTAAFFGLIYGLASHSVGMGDVLLASAVSLWLEPPSAAVFLFFSFLLGAVGGIALLLFRQKRGQDSVRFAPFLAAGGMVAYVWGEALWCQYMLLF